MKRFLPVIIVLFLATHVSAGQLPELEKIRNISGEYFRVGVPTTLLVDIKLPDGGFRGAVKIVSGSVTVERRVEAARSGTWGSLYFRVPMLSDTPKLSIVFESDSGEKSETMLDEFSSSLSVLRGDEVLVGVMDAPAPPPKGNVRFVEIRQEASGLQNPDLSFTQFICNLMDPGFSLETYDLLLRKSESNDEEWTEGRIIFDLIEKTTGTAYLEYTHSPEDAPGLEAIRPKKRDDIMPRLVSAAESSFPIAYSSQRRYWAVLLGFVSIALALLALSVRRLRKRWIVFGGAITIAIIGCVIFRLFLFTPTPVRLVTAMLIETETGDKLPLESSFVGFVSARNSFDLAVPVKSDMRVDTIRRDAFFESYPATFAYRDTGEGIIPDVNEQIVMRIQPDKAVLFRLKTVGDFPGPVILDGNVRKKIVRNMVGSPLREVFLTDFMEARPIGLIPFGSSKEIDVTSAKAGFLAHARSFARGYEAPWMIRALLETEAERRRGDGAVYIIALGEKEKPRDYGIEVTDRADAPPLWIIKTSLPRDEW
ncbi:MAG: hypothetical protein ACYS8W_19230 [Planctomycetota bacterium]|jgi:hypothetical protein